MKLGFCFFIAVVFFIPVCGQEKNYVNSGYYEKIYIADSLYLVNDFNNSFKILNDLFEEMKPLDFDPYYEYRTYVKSAWLVNKKSQALEGLKDLISNHGLDWTSIENDTVLQSICEEMRLTKNLYDELHKCYISQTYPEIREKLKEMVILDQKYRSKGSYSNNRNEQDSIDEVNREELLMIIDEIGYPTLKKMGLTPDANFNESKVLNILLHFDFKTREEVLLPKIKQLVEIGDCNPEIYGYIYDQMQLYRKKPQKYGTYDGSTNVDSLPFHRKSIGLPHHKYQEWRFKKL